METLEHVNFQEIAEKNVYQISQIDESVLENALPFENIDRKQVEQSKSRQKLLDYKLLDLSFLAKKDKNGYPLFSIFHTKSTQCYYSGIIRCNSGQVEFTIPISSDVVWRHVKPIIKDLLKKAVLNCKNIINTQNIQFKLTSKFSGIVPKEVRNIIRANTHKFDHVCIISEADNWTYNETVTYNPPNPDPLVVGIKDDLAYLICTFYVTKLENYIKTEFTCD